MPERELDSVEVELLHLLQEGLPLVSRPFQEIAGRLGISEEEVLERVERLKEEKVIRRLGGVWSSPRLGFVSLLAALRVRVDALEEVAHRVSDYPGVTHNYQRDHHFNLWFTLTAESREEMDRILQEVRLLEGVEKLLELPAVRQFKVEVKFKWEGDSGA